MAKIKKGELSHMGTKLRHVTMYIDYVLSMSDQELERYFDASASEIRKDLTERKAAGEILIGSENCEGFDPVKGCPGHEKIDLKYKGEPGPWKYQKSSWHGVNYEIVKPDGGYIGGPSIEYTGNEERDLAHARLICAAHELLCAAQGLLKIPEIDQDSKEAKEAKAAIKRALEG